MSEDNRPTHELKLLDPDSGDTSLVGVAWEREGRYSIKLNVGVVLSYDSVKGKYLTLFKARTPEEWQAYHNQKRAFHQPSGLPSQKTTGYRAQYPDYVRKVHFQNATRSECPNRFMGKPSLSDDPATITCGKCKKVIKRQPVTELPVGPNEPPPK